MHYTWCADGPDLRWYQVARQLDRMVDKCEAPVPTSGTLSCDVLEWRNDLEFLRMQLQELRKHYYRESTDA